MMRTMTQPRPARFRIALVAITLLALAALTGLGWFNWWLRHTWTRIYPVCGSDGVVYEFLDPMIPEARDLFIGYKTSTLPQHTKSMATEASTYVRVVGDKVYARSWYWMLGLAERTNGQNYMNEDLAELVGRPDLATTFCSHFVQLATTLDRYSYTIRDYPQASVQEFLELLSFGVIYERRGEYTAVGRFFQRFEDEPLPEPEAE